MNNTGRVVAGFLVAPVAPGMLLCLYGLANGYGVAAVTSCVIVLLIVLFRLSVSVWTKTR
jgi:hypothetical protein